MKVWFPYDIINLIVVYKTRTKVVHNNINLHTVSIHINFHQNPLINECTRKILG